MLEAEEHVLISLLELKRRELYSQVMDQLEKINAPVSLGDIGDIIANHKKIYMINDVIDMLEYE